jgi:hypothetical protein
MEIWGDPLLSGTLFMIAYGITALLILRAAHPAPARERGFWRLCGFLFLFQLANTHLDLHALVWTGGRCLAHAQGWYDHRREIQVMFLALVAVMIVLLLLVVLKLFYRNILQNLLLTAGVTLALGFTLVKGVNYHGFEQVLNRQMGPFYIADLIEFSGIMLALAAAVLRLRGNRRPFAQA